MSRVLNDPDDFPGQAVAGLASAFPQHLKPVFGGVARATVTRPGKVALVVGGGSGHYPAFSGWVGQGFSDGAVCGNIFSSPSGAQAYSVCKAADRGAGVLIGFGNYAGDVLQFGQAAERLKSEGIEARCLLVTDDIASAGPEELAKRRGIAGDLPTFKVTGAACEAGMSVDEVEAVFNRVNHRTRSFGVAFKGCTLPGADHPLFEVTDGRMGVGMGIHGEPGIHDADLGTADDLARMLVDGLLADRPDEAGSRVVPIVNGLGDTKYEELFVIWNDIRRRLVEAGLEIVDPQVGEFVTSLDMAGLSLTLLWLDEVIEPLWLAPCDTPAYRRGAVSEVELDTAELSQQAEEVTVATAGSPASQEVANTVVGALDLIRSILMSRQEELGRLDSIAGDGDHGIGMTRGSTAAVAAAREVAAEGAGALTTLAAAGAAWSEQAGGTSGALWGAALTAFGTVLGDDQGCHPGTVVEAAAASLDAVKRLGGAQLGDKTMIDAMEPFVETLRATGTDLPTAWGAAVLAADQGARSTAGIVARLGRSRPLGEKSLGTPDPGAISFVDVVRAVGSVIG